MDLLGIDQAFGLGHALQEQVKLGKEVDRLRQKLRAQRRRSREAAAALASFSRCKS